MSEKVSIKDIAKHVGVAPSTVSRVLNNASFAYPVSEKTRKKILTAVKQLNYTPNVNARRLSQSKSYTLALVIPSFENYHAGYYVFDDLSFNQTMKGIEECLRTSKYRLLLVFKDQKYVTSKEYIRLFEGKNIDGMLVWGPMRDDDYLEELYKYPLVQLNSYFRQDVNACTVGIDNYSGGYQVADHMLKQGRRRILYIMGKNDVSISHEHKQGYLAALTDHGISPDQQLIVQGNFQRQCGRDIIKQAIHDKIEFDAVQCLNNGIARECCKTLTEHNLKPGVDILIGGGSRLREHHKPDSSHIVSFYADYCRMGSAAMKTLQQQIDGNRPNNMHQNVEIELIK